MLFYSFTTQFTMNSFLWRGTTSWMKFRVVPTCAHIFCARPTCAHSILRTSHLHTCRYNKYNYNSSNFIVILNVSFLAWCYRRKCEIILFSSVGRGWSAGTPAHRNRKTCCRNLVLSFRVLYFQSGFRNPRNI